MKYTSILLAASLCVCLPLSLFTHAMFGVIPPLIGVAAFVEHRVAKKSFPIIDRDFAVLFALLVTVCFLSSTWSIIPEETITRGLKLIGVFLGGLLLFAGARYFSQTEREYVLRALPVFLVITATLFVIEVNLGYPLFLLHEGPQETTRYTLYITNWMAVISVAFFWPALQYTVNTGQIKLAAAMSALLCLLVYFSTSESAILGFWVGAIIFLGGRYIKRLPLVTFILVAAGLVLSPWLAHWLFIFRPDFLLDLKGASAAQRMEIWDFLARQIFEQPVLGWGVESTGAMTLETDKLFFSGSRVVHPHNSALQLWIEMGIPGVLLGLGFLALVFRRIASASDNIYMVAGFSSLLAISLTAYGLWQGWWLGVMFIAATLFRLVSAHGRQNRSVENTTS